MKEYKTNKDLMFYCTENEFKRFIEIIAENVDKKYYLKEYNFIKNKFIELLIGMKNNSVKIIFKYSNKLFDDCYIFDGLYMADRKENSEKALSNIISIIESKILLVTKKDELFCCVCKKLIGYIFNEDGEISLHDEEKPNQLFSDYEIEKCVSCGNYACEDCGSVYGCAEEWYYEFVCDNCNNYQEDDDNYILNWISCRLDDGDENYENCCECNNREECLERASDSHRGNIMFEDSLDSGFWDSIY